MGRPSFKPSDEQRAEVARWSQAKVSIEEIARRLVLTPKTLRKHFAAELGISPPAQVNTEQQQAEVLDPPGRAAPFRPSDEQREMALILSGARWPHADIAHYLQMPVEVLEEHFAEELALGPKKFTAEVIRASWYAARGGNQAAAKICLVMGGAGPQKDTAAPQPAAEGLRGKKELAVINANAPDTSSALGALLARRQGSGGGSLN